MGSHPIIRLHGSALESYGTQKKAPKTCSPWIIFCYFLTFWAIPPLLSWIGGMKDLESQRAFREKIALCVIILFLCILVALLTFFLPILLCPPKNFDQTIKYQEASTKNFVWAYGRVYNASQLALYFKKLKIPQTGDVSFLFPLKGECGVEKNSTLPSKSNLEAIFLASSLKLEFEWDDLIAAEGKLVVINGKVVNITSIRNSFGPGVDVSLSFANSKSSHHCLLARHQVGTISKDTPGCFLAKVVLALTLFVIVFVVLLRFMMAVIFNWFLINQKPSTKGKKTYGLQKSSSTRLAAILSTKDSSSSFSFSASFASCNAMPEPDIQSARLLSLVSSSIDKKKIPTTKLSPNDDMYVLLLVTCYSEGYEAITNTLDSLAECMYPQDKRLLMVISDGIVTGSGNPSSTPDILLSLMGEDTVCFQLNPSQEIAPLSYNSIGDGNYSINKALVYAGHYRSSSIKGERIPMILIIKCGSVSAKESVHPGNRGKRDSQVSIIHNA